MFGETYLRAIVFCSVLGARLSAVSGAVAQPTRTEAQRTEVVEYSLDVGEQRVIPTDGVRSYSEGTPGIVDVRLTRDARQFVLVGQKAGVTSLLLILSDGHERQLKITVREPGLTPARADVAVSTVVARDNIRLDFYFVELRASSQTRIGVTWPSTFGGGQLRASFDVLGGAFQNATAVITDQALPRLDLARTVGWAKILRQAAVVTANGTEATFSGGGEVNIPVRGALAAEIRSIEFGSTVKVLPRYDQQTGRIELTIAAEVSDLTDDNGTGAPGRATANLQTVVNLELGQSLVLGGLTARSESHSKTGIPWLSQIPILGIFFGSTGFRKEDSENVVLIVPTVVNPVSVSARERIREALDIYERYEGDLERPTLVPELPRRALR